MSANSSYYTPTHDYQAQAADRTALIAVCLVLGLGIGVALALMFAPESGEKTRNQLAHTVEGKVNEGRHRVEPALNDLQKEMKDLRRKVEERLS